MWKRMGMAAAAGILALGFTATGALAFHCPKLIKAGRNLAAKATGPVKAKATALLDEAMALHKAGNHKKSMQIGADAVALLAK